MGAAAREAALMPPHIVAQFVFATPPVAKLSRAGSRCSCGSCPGARPPAEEVGAEVGPVGTVRLRDENAMGTVPPPFDSKPIVAFPGPALSTPVASVAGRIETGRCWASVMPASAAYHQSRSLVPL